MVRAKPLAPGTFHDCSSCSSTMLPGEPRTLDGWADGKDNLYFGSIEEFPDQETADNYLHPDYRPAQRFVKKLCANGCYVEPMKADETFTIYNLWYCGSCDSRYKQEETAGVCCD
jgi:hypothetical protein